MTEEKTASTSNNDGKMAEEIASNEDGVMTEEPEEPEAHDVEDDGTYVHLPHFSGSGPQR